MVVDTGTCVLSHSDLSACAHYTLLGGQREPDPTPVAASQQIAATESAQERRFPGGLELGTEQSAAIMRARYSYLIGILGSWGAGKTCFLLSLYLMAARGALPSGYSFAGSQTLAGFEARANHIRQWTDGPLPDQLADHTHLLDPRKPSLLHLALRSDGNSKPLFDVLLTDLPGEWSKNLVDRVDTAERFAFLRRADGIILVVDGPLMASPKRHPEILRTKHLLDRLVEAVQVDTTVPLVVVASKCDEIMMRRTAAIDELEQYAQSLGFRPEVVLSAAFSRKPEVVPNGQGIFEALEKIIEYPAEATPPSQVTLETAGRAFLDFSNG